MQIKIHLDEQYLEELANFLQADIKYEHSIDFYKNRGSTPAFSNLVEVHIYYPDFVSLVDWKMNKSQSNL